MIATISRRWRNVRWASFKLHDRHHRVLLELSWDRIQIVTFVFEKWSDGDGRTGLRLFYDPAMISRQRMQEQCSKCNRFVPHACEVPGDPERCMQADGPWDGACREFYYPWESQ